MRAFPVPRHIKRVLFHWWSLEFRHKQDCQKASNNFADSGSARNLPWSRPATGCLVGGHVLIDRGSNGIKLEIYNVLLNNYQELGEHVSSWSREQIFARTCDLSGRLRCPAGMHHISTGNMQTSVYFSSNQICQTRAIQALDSHCNDPSNVRIEWIAEIGDVLELIVDHSSLKVGV